MIKRFSFFLISCTIQAQTPEQNTFKIILDGNKIGVGFAFDDSKFVTNAHVALVCKFITCDNLYAENNNLIIKLDKAIVIDKRLDFAIFGYTFQSITPTSLACLNKPSFYFPKVNETVYLYNPTKTECRIIDSNYTQLFKPYFAYDCETQRGYSGSPVFDAESRLVGLHWGGKPGYKMAIPYVLIMQKYIDILY